MSKWKDIESAPKDGTKVLLYWPNWNAEPVIGFFNHRWVIDGHEYYAVSGPTYWTSLPDPPKE